MSFNINTELEQKGVLIDGDECVFTDSYHGERTDEVKRSIASTVSIASFLFSSEYSNPKGKRAIQNHQWRDLGTHNIEAAPLCLHSHVYQTVKESRDITSEEITIISSAFEQVARFLLETIENAASQSEPKEVDNIHDYLNRYGIESGVEGDKCLNVKRFAEHCLNVSKAPEMLLKISRAFLQVHTPFQSRRILELQKNVRLAALTPRPVVIDHKEEVDKGKEVIERVDLSTYKPRIRRPRRTSSTLQAVKCNGRTVYLSPRQSQETSPESVGTPSQPQGTSESNEQQEGWCVLL